MNDSLILHELRELRDLLTSHNLQDLKRFNELDKKLGRLSVKTNTLWLAAGALLYLIAERALSAAAALANVGW